MILAATLLALAPAAAAAPAIADDPRPAIVERMGAGQPRIALEEVGRLLGTRPELARRLGLDLLRGALLEQLGRDREAAEAYAAALSSGSGLEPWARWRLALLQERLGHPEVAAGLVATLLATDPPDPLVRPGLELLHRSLAAGGDCRLLGSVQRDRLPSSLHRLRDLVQADCLLRSGHPDDAARMLRELLGDDTRDGVAWDAAGRLARLRAAADPGVARLIGMTAFHHRDFISALAHLRGAASLSNRWFDPGGREAAYSMARSLFWLGHYDQAAKGFADLLQGPSTAQLRADGFCQLGRSLELAARRTEALAAFHRSLDEDPDGEWAGTALLSVLRLEVEIGDAAKARADLAQVARSSSLRRATARGAMFLGVTDLLRGDLRSVRDDLDTAARSGEASPRELSYWRGRLAEARGDLQTAVTRYLDVLGRDPYHPLAVAARRRLAAPGLRAEVERRRIALAARTDPRSLHAASLLLGERTPEGLRARSRGLASLARRSRSAPWLDWSPVPVTEWPVWQQEAARPAELLVGLGLFAEPGSDVGRFFPTSDLRLGFTGASCLVFSGASVRRGIAVAEALFDRCPSEVPVDWIAPELRRLLYPFPWAALIRAQATAFGVDPALLAAVIREESRFDPRAVSPAAARGLLQLTLPTARRIARETGFRLLRARDLERPEVSIPLGAAYLAELSRRFPRAEAAVVAAYNAGPDQAALWRQSCVSGEPEEYLAKISFGETRAYVVRVLESREIYRALYGGATGP
jgi:tetratricopeptide (TPR) repeat protein